MATATAPRFLYHYPETTGRDAHMLDPGPIADVAARAEAAGFDGFSLTEHPAPSAKWLDAGGHQSLDPIVAFAAAAAVTSRIRLVTHLVVAPYRNPFLLAKAAATVDVISGGRMTLGIGTGYHKAEFFALGVDMDERNALFDEILDTLPLHWSGEPFSYHGRHFSARDIIALPRPLQQPVPVWIGGNSKLSRRRAAERGQGWMPMLGPPSLSVTARTHHIASTTELGELITEVREMASAAGRTEPLDFLCAYQDPSLATPAVDAERHREGFAALAEAGATWLVVGSNTRSSDATYKFLDEFGETYLS